MKRIVRIVVLVFILIAVCTPASVRADVAPPAYPPGSNPEPGSEITQVRMVAETVVIEVLQSDNNQARVTADFTMRNLGTAAESMGVRFPLSADDGFGRFPEVRNLSVKVDGKTMTTRRIMAVDPVWGWGEDVPWAEFNVTFPPNQDVNIQVTYTLDGTGEYPFISYSYIFHTGAGWKDTIGSADLIVRLPYEANPYNVILDEQIGWSQTTTGGVFSGNEIKWRFEDFEPERENNFEISLVMPSAWRKVLNEQSNLQKDPNDGEAWGRLGKLYKEMFFYRRGFRLDAGGQELYQLSVQAYEQAVTLKPDDALWHAGFADLLAVHAYYDTQEGTDSRAEMLRSMQEIDLAIGLAPDDSKVQEIAEKIYFLFPEAIQQLESGYDYLWLTATPELVLAQAEPTETPIEAASTPPATAPPPAAESAVPAQEAEPTPAPATPKNPVCGTAFLIPFALVWFLRRRDNHLL